MILPDVNVLIYAYQVGGPRHDAYAAWLSDVRHHDTLALAEASLLGFVRVISDPRIFSPVAPTGVAIQFTEALRRSPRAVMLTPTAGSWRRFTDLVADDGGIRGKLVPDAWLAALAISHGARLATADRGFARFDGLDWFDPVAG